MNEDTLTRGYNLLRVLYQREGLDPADTADPSAKRTLLIQKGLGREVDQSLADLERDACECLLRGGLA